MPFHVLTKGINESNGHSIEIGALSLSSYALVTPYLQQATRSVTYITIPKTESERIQTPPPNNKQPRSSMRPC